MKSLLTITALFEAGTGVALMLFPASIVPVLLGIPFSDDSLHIVSGITGSALIALAIACWLFRNAGPPAALMVKAMLGYNIVASLVLLYAGLGLSLSAIGLWPAIIIHTGLAVWCIASLRK